MVYCMYNSYHDMAWNNQSFKEVFSHFISLYHKKLSSNDLIIFQGLQRIKHKASVEMGKAKSLNFARILRQHFVDSVKNSRGLFRYYTGCFRKRNPLSFEILQEMK